jgi:hypothetical protein
MIKDLIYISDIDIPFNRFFVEKVTVAVKKTIPTFSKFDPEEDQKIYIPSYVTVPKTKFREWIKSKSIRLTTKLDESDIVVLDDDFDYFLNQETTRLFTYRYFTKEFLEILAPLRPDIASLFEDYSYPYFLVNNRVRKYFDDILSDANISHEFDLVYSPAKIFKDSQQVEILLSKTIVSSTELMESMQKDETIIDKDYYRQLDNMLKSKDADNHVVAMEIMANSNYTKSCVYLMMLIMNNYNAIDNSKTKRHVNFKSLLNYLNLHPSNLYVSINQIIYFMFDRNLLTIETLDILRDEVLQDSVYAQHFQAGNNDLLQPLEVALDCEPVRQINNGNPYIFKIKYDRKD